MARRKGDAGNGGDPSRSDVAASPSLVRRVGRESDRGTILLNPNARRREGP